MNKKKRLKVSVLKKSSLLIKMHFYKLKVKILKLKALPCRMEIFEF